MSNAREQCLELEALLRREHHSLAEFLLALVNFDRRRSWLQLGHSSLYYFLHRELRLSSGSAYYRATAAKLLHKFPEIIEPLRDGRLCIMTVVELAKVLTPENRAHVLPRFYGASKTEAKEIVAELSPDRPVPQRAVFGPIATPNVAARNPTPFAGAATVTATLAGAARSSGRFAGAGNVAGAGSSGPNAPRSPEPLRDDARRVDQPHTNSPGIADGGPLSGSATNASGFASPVWGSAQQPSGSTPQRSGSAAQPSGVASQPSSHAPLASNCAPQLPGSDSEVAGSAPLHAEWMPAVDGGDAASGMAVAIGATMPAPQQPAPQQPAPQQLASAAEMLEVLSAELRRLHITVSKSFVEKLKAARDALSHSRESADFARILETGLDLVLEHLAVRKGLVRNPRAEARASKQPGYIPAYVKRDVFKRDRGCCQWPLASGGICGSRKQLEFDHKIPRARGGPSTVDNVRVLCRTHNKLAAEQEFGFEWMKRFTTAARAVEASPSSQQERPASGGPAQPHPPTVDAPIAPPLGRRTAESPGDFPERRDDSATSRGPPRGGRYRLHHARRPGALTWAEVSSHRRR